MKRYEKLQALLFFCNSFSTRLGCSHGQYLLRPKRRQRLCKNILASPAACCSGELNEGGPGTETCCTCLKYTVRASDLGLLCFLKSWRGPGS